MNDNHKYYHCIFDDASNADELPDADYMQCNKELENFRLDLCDWTLCNNESHKSINKLLQLFLKYNKYRTACKVHKKMVNNSNKMWV